MSELGEAGLAALQRWADAFDRADLDLAIYALSEAFDAEPWHHDALRWHGELCRLYAVRGDLDDAVADLDTAVELTEELVELSGRDDTVHDPAVIALGDRLWEQARLNGFADPDTLVKRYERLDAEAVGPLARQAVRAMCGMALLDVDEPTATDRAIAMLEDAISLLAEVPEDDPFRDLIGDGRVAWLMTVLSWAYQARSRDRGDLDRAIEVACAAVERDRTEPATRMRPVEFLANAYDLRWQARDAEDDESANDDLDAAIAAGSQCADDAGTALFRGILLAQRADRRDDAHDAALAATLLVEAAAADPDGSAPLLGAAATACRVRWEITGDLDELETGVRLAERAAAAARDDFFLMYAHTERMYAEHSLRENGRDRPGRSGSSSRLAETVEDAVRVLDRAIRADPEDRAFFAGYIGIMAFCAVDPDSGTLDLARARGLLSMAARAVPDEEGRALFASMLSLADVLADISNVRPSYGPAMRRLADAHTATEAYAEIRERVSEALASAMVIRAARTGNVRLLTASVRLTGRTRRWQPPTAGRRPRGPNLGVDDPLDHLTADVLLRVRRGQEAAAREAIVAAEGLLAARDNGFGRDGVAYLRALAAMIDPLAGPLLATPIDDPGPGLAGAGFVVAALTDLALGRQELARGFPQAARKRAEHVERLLDRIPKRERATRQSLATLAGLIRLLLAETADGGPVADADAAVSHLQSAIAGAAGVMSTAWARLTMWCGHALRLGSVPDPAGSRAMGLSALQGHAWQVFAQSGTDHAMIAARAAAADAATLVSWCLTDRAAGPAVLEELITALDGARALVLRAFGASRRVPDLLRARRRDDLATEWEASAGQGRDLLSGAAMLDAAGRESGIEVPDELRHQVVAVLGENAVFGLETFTSAEIRDNLRAAGRDALLYLVPGAAVVVPADADPYLIDLPGLSEEPVRRYARPDPGVRDLEPASRADPADLDGLCAWAWESTMGPLIAAAPGRRVVLVPMGRLALVPWHAAYRDDGGRRHFAVEDLVVSYSPSARLLAEATASADAGPIGSALIVGDPTGDLPAAGDEARTVHQRFYPEGTYLDSARPDDVLRWLSEQPAGAAVLHLACHAAVDPARPTDARLILAGGDLSVRDLLDRSRQSALNVDQVFLAACSTGAASDDYDEALSLASSFLAAGARTVIGSLWPVPDDDTALLMYLVHYYLRGEGCDPATALHRAQLWMLDPGRSMPADTPERLLRRHRATGAVPDLSAWAGFIHLGG